MNLIEKKKTQQKYIRKTSYYTVCIRWQKQIDRLCVCNDMRIIYNHIDILDGVVLK